MLIIIIIILTTVCNLMVIPVKVAGLSKEQEYYIFCDKCLK